MLKDALIFCVLLFLPWHAQAATVYLTPTEALKLIFMDSREIIAEKKTLKPDQKARVEKKLGYKLAKDTWTFFIAKSGANVDGYAIMDNEVGKVEPITFMLAINPGGSIRVLEILVYRESHGAEVKEQRFRRQFMGKTAADPLMLKNDIKHISGATLSSRAMTVGAARGLALWNAFYGK